MIMLADELDGNANWLQMQKQAHSRSAEIGLD